MKEIFQLLIARCKLIPGVLDVRIYNNQVKRQKEEMAMLYPAVLIEVANVTSQSRPGRYTDRTATIRFYLIDNSPLQSADPENQDMYVYDLRDAAEQYLNNFSGQGKFRPLYLTAENLDYNHDNVYVYELEYETGWKELAQPIGPIQTVTLTDIIVNGELDIDNPVLRTGDNQGYTFE